MLLPGLTNTYKKEQLEYIQDQINKIRKFVENKHYIANKISGRKSTLRSKLKTTSQEERLQKWKEHDY